jgi:hypothetical protein
MNPWMRNLLCGGGGGGGGVVLPPAGRTFLMSKSSLILDEGAGNPTWSRATKAWGFNELGYLEELASGCAFFGGARLVRNLFSKSELFSAATWVTLASTKTDNGNGSYTITGTGGTFSLGISENVATVGATMLATVRFSKGNHRYVGIRVGQYTTADKIPFYDFDTDTVSNIIPGATLSRTIVSPGVIDLAILAPGVTTSTVQIWGTESDGSMQTAKAAGKTFIIWRAQLVDVTNYDASYVPEYVSVGVLSSPYHGAGTTSTADGCKYFETDWQGAPIAAANMLGFRREVEATNNLLSSRNLTVQAITATTKRWNVSGTSGAEVVTNGTFAADLANWTPSVGAGGSITATGGICTFVSDGTGYTGIKNDAALTVGQTYVCIVVASGTGTLKFVSTLEISNIGAGTSTFSFVATGTTVALVRSAGIACNLAIDSISIKAAAVQCALVTGLDGIANTATTLTASAADATILQPITLASAARCASAYVKRRTGTGTISFTQDGGSTWTDITSQINGSTWSRVQITSTLANPSVGFKISTSGDAIDVDCVQNEAGAVATSPIVTTTAAVTRDAESLTYQTASNWSDTAGTAYIEAQPWQWSVGGLVGSATNGLLESASNSGATAYDGTNAANGPAGSPSGRKKLALRWTGATMDVSVGGVIGTAGTYDGAMGLSSLGIAVNSSGYFGPVAVWNYAMTDDEFKALTT